MERKYLSVKQMAGNNGLRGPPGLTNGPNVSNAKPGISLLNMSPGEQTLRPNRPLSRRKSEATARSGDESTSHHRKGGKKWGSKLKKDPPGRSLRKSRLDSEEPRTSRNVYSTDVQSKTSIRGSGR